MLRPITVMPIHPKNGDKYRNAKGITNEFRYGTWIVLFAKDDVLGLEKKQFT